MASPSCPACAEPLVVFELEGIEIDRCLACGGTWLDDGELALIAQRAGLEAGSRALRALCAAAPSGGPLAARSPAGARRCPRCAVRLEAFAPPGAARPSVELDRCPRGDGLWFDARELELVLAGDGGDAALAATGAFLMKLFRHKNES